MYVCADLEGCVLLCCEWRSDSWRGMGRQVWAVSSEAFGKGLCVYRWKEFTEQCREGRGQVSKRIELTARCNRFLFFEY